MVSRGVLITQVYTLERSPVDVAFQVRCSELRLTFNSDRETEAVQL